MKENGDAVVCQNYYSTDEEVRLPVHGWNSPCTDRHLEPEAGRVKVLAEDGGWQTLISPCPQITCRYDRMRTGFGWIMIGGTRNEHDIIIHTGGMVSKRKKNLPKPNAAEYGHTPFSAKELAFVQNECPAPVCIGTGRYGSLPLTPDTLTLPETRTAVVKPIPGILTLIEGEERKYASVLHMTCYK
jgi:hypothetical protein